MVKRTVQIFTPAGLGESVVWYMLATAAQRAIGLVRGVLLTWLLVQAQFGVYQLGLLMVNVLLPVLSLGLYEGVGRFVPEHETRRQLWSFTRYATTLCIAVGVGSCVLFVLAAQQAGAALFGPLAFVQGAGNEVSGLGSPKRLILVIGICSLSLMLYQCVCGLLKGRRMFRALSALELGSGAMFTLLAIACALIWNESGVPVLLSYAVVNLALGGAFGVLAIAKLRQESDQHEPYRPAPDRGRLLHYSIGLAGGAFAWQLLLLFPAWYLNRIHGAELFASFSALRVIAQIGHVACAAFGVVIASIVTKTWEAGRRSEAHIQLDSTTKASLILVTAVCLILAATKSLVIQVLDPVYHSAERFLPLLLLFFLQAGVLSLISIRFTIMHQARQCAVCWSVGACVSIVLGLLLIQPEDAGQALMMACWASIGGTSSAVLMALLLLARSTLAPGRGLVVVLVLGCALLGGSLLAVIGTVVLVFVAICPGLVLSAQERQQLIHSLKV